MFIVKMDVQIKRLDEANVVVITVMGMVDRESIIKTIDKLIWDMRDEGSLNVLWDVTQADVSQLSNYELWRLSDKTKELWKGQSGKSALVFSDILGKETGNLYTNYMKKSDRPVKVFRDVKTAIKWLKEAE